MGIVNYFIYLLAHSTLLSSEFHKLCRCNIQLYISSLQGSSVLKRSWYIFPVPTYYMYKGKRYLLLRPKFKTKEMPDLLNQNFTSNNGLAQPLALSLILYLYLILGTVQPQMF